MRKQLAADRKRDLLSSDTALRQQALVHFAKNEYDIDAEVVKETIACLGDETLLPAALDTVQVAQFDAYAAVEPLVGIVKTHTGRVQFEAFIALLRIDPIRVTELDFDTTPLLLQALAGNDGWASCYAAHCLCLGHSKDPAVVKGLAEAALSREGSTAYAAHFGLYSLGPELAVPLILQRLKSPADDPRDPLRRPPEGPPPDEAEVIHSERMLNDYELWTLAHAGEAARPTALCMVRSLNYRPLAAYSLAELGPYAAPYLVETRGEPERKLTAEKEFILEAWGEKAVPSFVAALRQGNRGVKHTAAMYLQYLGPRSASAVDLLVETLGETDIPLRRQVLRALRSIGKPAAPAAPKLREWAEKEQDPILLLEFAATIYSLSPTDEHRARYLALIEKAFEEEIISQTRIEADYLLQNVEPYHLPSLFNRIGLTYNDRRLVDVLSEHRDPAMVPRLAQLLHHSKGEVRRSAATIAAAYGPAAKALAPDLDPLANHGDVAGLYEAEAEALASVAVDEQAAPALAKLFLQRDSVSPSGTIDFAIRAIGSRMAPASAPAGGGWKSIVPPLAPGYRAPRDLDDRIQPVAFGPPPTFDRSLPSWMSEIDQKLKYEFEKTVLILVAKGSAARCAVPRLLEFVADGHNVYEWRVKALDAIATITRSPLVVNMMLAHGVVSLDIVQRLPSQSVVDLVPFLISHRSFEAWLLLPRAGVAARAALPQLTLRDVDRPDNQLLAVARLTAWRIEQPPYVIPDLIDNLNGYLAHREYIAWALGRIGPSAAPAIPRLARLAFNGDNAAAEALEQIDPAAPARWGFPSTFLPAAK